VTIRHIDIDPRTLSNLPILRSRIGRRVLLAYNRFDATLVGLLDRYGLTALRIALALVFIWFGALKVIDRSPVAELVAETVYWLPADAFMRFLGVWELVIGLGLLFGIGMRVVLALFFAQMAGTFLVFVMKPGEAFEDGNPFLLTVLGEFVVKNLVLIAAGLVLGSTVRKTTADKERISG
jgi:uncharacterized membrane protein YkgB